MAVSNEFRGYIHGAGGAFCQNVFYYYTNAMIKQKV